jgi:uncharacterized protein (TIGR00725 family)
MLTLDRGAAILLSGNRRFDPMTRTWAAYAGGEVGEPVTSMEAVAWLQRETPHRLRVPVGVIGPRQAVVSQLALAEAVGAGLAEMGLPVICGGRQGIMEAVARGATAKGGLVIGLLPGPDAGEANPHVSVPIATGIGEARNALIARAAFCLIAVGDSHGTLSEIALGLQFGKSVLGIGGAARLPGVRQFEETDALLDAVADIVLSIPDPHDIPDPQHLT